MPTSLKNFTNLKELSIRGEASAFTCFTHVLPPGLKYLDVSYNTLVFSPRVWRTGELMQRLFRQQTVRTAQCACTDMALIAAQELEHLVMMGLPRLTVSFVETIPSTLRVLNVSDHAGKPPLQCNHLNVLGELARLTQLTILPSSISKAVSEVQERERARRERERTRSRRVRGSLF